MKDKETKERFDAFRKGMNLSYLDIAKITGNTEASIKSVVNSGRIPAWAKLSIWMYETGQYQNPIWQKMKDIIVGSNATDSNGQQQGDLSPQLQNLKIGTQKKRKQERCTRKTYGTSSTFHTND